MEELAHQAQIQSDGAFWIWVCIIIVIMTAIGWNGFRKLRAFNHKHHIVSIENYETKVYDEDADEEFSVVE
ncbi:MAG: hypothetical protein MJZ66_11270 [Bacteroidales bacterium]|nr:hypothetical protein [Bacteroidales bacterium]